MITRTELTHRLLVKLNEGRDDITENDFNRLGIGPVIFVLVAAGMIEDDQAPVTDEKQ